MAPHAIRHVCIGLSSTHLELDAWGRVISGALVGAAPCPCSCSVAHGPFKVRPRSLIGNGRIPKV